MEVNNRTEVYFNGVKTSHKVPAQVKEAINQSEVLQKLGKSYDIKISHYRRTVHDMSFGPLMEYGLNYRIREIVPNLFNKRCTFDKQFTSDYALSLLHEPNKTGKREKQMQDMAADLVNEIETLTINDIKSWIG